MAAKKKFESTRTEIQTGADTALSEALNKANTHEPVLIVIQGDQVGQVFNLNQGVNRIGRHPNAEISVKQRAISAHHAVIRVVQGVTIVEDLGSTNGTFLNGEKIKRPEPLEAGALLKIGSTVFRYADTKLDAEFSQNLHKQVNTDPMTGVYNKGYFLKALNSSLEVAKGGYPLSLIIFDLDHFKKINDSYGHLAGDYVLIECCRLLKESVVRTDDVLARYGGEEFALVMPDTNLEAARLVAERIRATIEGHKFIYESKLIPVTASLGVTEWGPKIHNPEDMIHVADELLYKSKKAGRNRVSI